MFINVLWILIASAPGFSIAAIFTGWLKLQRDAYYCNDTRTGNYWSGSASLQ